MEEKMDQPASLNSGRKIMHYLALGDSYTIGEGLPVNETYAAQLTQALKVKQISIEDPTIIARTGWTTTDLLHGIDKAKLKSQYDLVTLLIGVNNQYQNLPLADYSAEFRDLLSIAIRLAGNDSSHVIVLSIPDYSVTPFGRNMIDSDRIPAELDAYNRVSKKISSEFRVGYLDVTADSRKAGQDPLLLAQDGLHYSAKEYGIWASALLPMTIRMMQ
jgi:lysophospholipase L1-like esterase